MDVSVHSATRRRSTGRGSVDLSNACGGFGLEVEAVLRRVPRDDDRREDHRHVVARLARQDAWLRRSSVQKLSTLRGLDRALHAGPGRRCRRPAPDASRRRRSCSACGGTSRRRPSPFPDPTARRCTSRWRRPFSRPVPRMNCQTPLALRARQRVRLEGALDQRHVRQVERQPFGAEDVLNHRQVLAAAPHAFFDEVVQPALEQLDVGEHALVQRNRNVVRRRPAGPTGPRPSVRARRAAVPSVADIASSSSIEAGSYFFSVKPSPVASARTS